MKRTKSGKRNYTVPVLTVRRAPGRHRHRGLLTAGWAVYPCALGEAGVSVFKREGDAKTPAGRFALVKLYLRPGNSWQFGLSGIKSRARLIQQNMGWCDDASDSNYNREIKLPYRARHEILFRADGLYDIFFVIDWNIRPRIRGAGSAIFMHIAKTGYKPTEGCIAVDRRAMSKLIARMGTHTKILVYP